VVGFGQRERRHVVRVGDEAGRDPVVGVHVLPEVGEHDIGIVAPERVDDPEAVFERVVDPAVLEAEKLHRVDPQHLAGRMGLCLADVGDLRFGIRAEPAVLAPGHVGDRYPVAAGRMLRERSATEDVGVVGMGDGSHYMHTPVCINRYQIIFDHGRDRRRSYRERSGATRRSRRCDR